MQVEETTQSPPLRPTRAGFVRGLPLTMPVQEVIERGREAGIELQPSDIHAARYYMRQGGGGEGAGPQQLTLGGKFVTTREPHRNGSSVASNGSSASKANGLEKTGVVEKLAADSDDDFEAAAPVAPRRRKIVQPRGIQQAQPLSNANGNGNGSAEKVSEKIAEKNGKDNAVPLHDRLQARLPNVTFRETAPAEKQVEKASARKPERHIERQTERQTERLTARAKQERQARQERLEKATIGKALLDADSVKSRNKRAARSSEALEEQVRLIALRVGTQRVRELLDAMEELARKA